MARLALLLAAAAVLAGCARGEPAAEPPAPAPAPGETAEPPLTEAEPDTARLAVYFLRGEKVGAASRHVEPTAQVGRAALEALLEGPTAPEREAGLGSEIPEGTALLGLIVEADGHAVVDLSREFESGGGSLSMTARVGQVVYTLTQFPTVDRVSIRLGGEEVDGIGGEGVPADDLSRDDFEGLTPAILVESPAVGDRVTSPLRMQGTANTFEATFQVEVVDADGRIIHERFVTATSGSGVRGTFDATVEFELERPGTGALVVFEISAADGSRQNVVDIPLELAP